MNDLVNVDTAAILVGLGVAALALGVVVALVLRGRMALRCWKCGVELRAGAARGDDGRWWCQRCINMAGGPS